MSFYNDDVVDIAKSVIQQEQVKKDRKGQLATGAGVLAGGGALVAGAERYSRPYGGSIRSSMSDRKRTVSRTPYFHEDWLYGKDEIPPKLRGKTGLYSFPSSARERISESRAGQKLFGASQTRAGKNIKRAGQKLGVTRVPLDPKIFDYKGLSAPSPLRAKIGNSGKRLRSAMKFLATRGKG